jgi:hypothetical protein
LALYFLIFKLDQTLAGRVISTVDRRSNFAQTALAAALKKPGQLRADRAAHILKL